MGLGWLLTQKGKAIFHISGKDLILPALSCCWAALPDLQIRQGDP